MKTFHNHKSRYTTAKETFSMKKNELQEESIAIEDEDNSSKRQQGKTEGKFQMHCIQKNYLIYKLESVRIRLITI